MKVFQDELLVNDRKHYAFDVVSGMNVSAHTVKPQSEFRDSSHYACSNSSQKHFDYYSERYVWNEE